ncbi:MAG: MBL fold metallo-hydrolase [Clostridia bacterium]|nr:MBL fold metallo-hydrolase [Clostridia bacterium]
MVIKCLPTGMFGSNCYIIGDKGECALIDAGVESSEVQTAVAELGLKIKYIILTHVHIDHICFADKIKESTDAGLLAHQDDAPALTDPVFNGSAMFGRAKSFGNADMLLKDGDIIEIGSLQLEVIHTPGHTPGGICIKAGNCLFTGDTLFKTSIGRTDFRNGSMEDIMKSIKDKLMKLGDEIIVYPGHGEATSIGFERKYNPFLRI